MASEGMPESTMGVPEKAPLVSGNSSSSGSTKNSMKPLVFSNPDGSLRTAYPPGYKMRTPPQSPRSALNGLRGQLGLDAMREDFEFVFSRHMRMLLTLIFVQFVIEVVFNATYVVYSEDRMHEIEYFYHATTPHAIKACHTAFWIAFGVEITFCATYYALAARAAWSADSRRFRVFAYAALVGLALQVAMAYVNKFNLLVFFLRCIAYLYSRFISALVMTWNEGTDEDDLL